MHSCLTKYKNKQETPTWLASALNFSFPTTIPTKLIHSMEVAQSIWLDLSVALTNIAFRYGITAS